MSGSPRAFVQVAPLKAGGSQKSLFTYHSRERIASGALVRIPFGRIESLGLVIASVTTPEFKTRPVAEILPLPRLPAHMLELAEWISAYYAVPLAKVWQTILPAGLMVKKLPPPHPADKPAHRLSELTLQSQQKLAVKKIVSSASRSFLLHGVTGSGKTLVYIELAAQALKRNRSVIVLVPEIALTAQLAQAFIARFGVLVNVTHSALTAAKRRSLWLESLVQNTARIVIGPRSALFTPLADIGFIIVDESHETSYKQDQSPRYHAVSAAAKLAQIVGAKLILGSATPSANDYFLAGQNRLELIKMDTRVHRTTRDSPRIVDLGKNPSKASFFISTPLLELLKSTLARHKQAILFMNRRGSARQVLCGHCGWVATCPNCHIPLTFHADYAQLLCHWCGLAQPPPALCPICRRLEIRFLGGGTKRVEAEITNLLPQARVARLDKDSFDPKTMAALFKNLQAGRIDILIGTQMVAKGLDLANVETIGVVLADNMLYLPDFSASERTFQLLYQVSGRAGRRAGARADIIIQTYSPRHPAIQAAASGDYAGFIDNELAERKLLRYPPYAYLLKLSVARSARAAAQSAATKLGAILQRQYSGKVEILGPAPSWQETLGGSYRWQLIAKSKQRQNLVEIIRSLPPNWSHDLDPINLL